MTNPVSKGFGTSEFAMTLAGIIASLLVSFGIIKVDEAASLSNLIATAIAGAVALISIWGIISQYVAGRNQIKQTMLSSGISPVQAETQTQPAE